MNIFLKSLIKKLLKLRGYVSITNYYIYNTLYKRIYNTIYQLYPNYVISINIINTDSNYVYKYAGDFNTINTYLLGNDKIYYDISIWNKNTSEIEYYLLNNTNLHTLCYNKDNLVNNSIYDTFIQNVTTLYSSHSRHHIVNNIYAIYISTNDISDIFEKYRTSISIPNNLNVHALYLYYCYKRNICPSNDKTNYPITIVDYNLDEKIFTYNEMIDCDKVN